MSHMLPPDDERQDTPKSNGPTPESSLMIKFFTVVVILMGLFILGMLIKNKVSVMSVGNPYSNNGGLGTLGNGSSLGGAGSGSMEDEEMPTPESITREMKAQGGGMRVFVNSPNGGEMKELTPEQQEAMAKYLDEAMKNGGTPRAISKPVGGDNTEATPVGGAGGGQ